MRRPEKSRIMKKMAAIQKVQFIPTDIPTTLQEFYTAVGYFKHPVTGQDVLKLTSYQQICWDDKDRSRYRLYLKSQKIGLTMLFLLEDFYHALTDCRGKEILLVAQTKEKAREHMQDLQRLIRGSRFKSWLIEDVKSTDQLLKDERTKVDTIYMYNPDERTLPTKIIALGITSPGALLSYKRVKHIHMSDITLAEMVDERFNQAFEGLQARLTNTDGSMVIECPPRGTSGPVWEICNVPEIPRKEGYLLDVPFDPPIFTHERFLVRRLTYHLGMEHGLITQEYIDGVKRKPLFSMYYEGTFYSGDKSWFSPEQAGQIGDDETSFIDTIGDALYGS